MIPGNSFTKDKKFVIEFVIFYLSYKNSRIIMFPFGVVSKSYIGLSCYMFFHWDIHYSNLSITYEYTHKYSPEGIDTDKRDN